jgi:hypothetical protein
MKDLIDRERNAMDLYDQRDSKGQMTYISLKGFLIGHLQLARNALNQLPVKFPAGSVASSNGVEPWGQNICADTQANARTTCKSATS